MKFKTIFIIFNTIIGVSFLILFILPFIMLEINQFSIIFSTNWIILCIFLFFIIVFNTYFIRNWKLFKLIEQENWPDLTVYLEKKIFKKKLYNKSIIKILINSYIVTSDLDAITKLYEYLKNNKKKIVKSFPLEFGIPFLLLNLPEESEKYFKSMLNEQKHKNWIKWNYAFSLMRQNKKDEPIKLFSEILYDKIDPILMLITLYMYYPIVKNNQELYKPVQIKIEDFLNSYSPNAWQKYLENEKKNIQAIILSKIITDAGNWIYNLNLEDEIKTLH